MKFRIINYYDRYKPQVYKATFNGRWFQDDWVDIGSPTGYSSIDAAKNCCYVYKQEKETKTVEEFEL